MRQSPHERSYRERIATFVAVVFMATGGFLGSTFSGLSLTSFLGAIAAGIFVMAWILVGTVAAGLDTVNDTLEEILSEVKERRNS